MLTNTRLLNPVHSTEYANLLAYFRPRESTRFFEWASYFHPIMQAVLPAIPVSFEMWVVGVEEMHGGRETKLLPILLGRQPSTSKPMMGLIAGALNTCRS